jgi:hypothetical protein
MLALNLFSALRTNSEMLESIERYANKKMKKYHWSFGVSKYADGTHHTSISLVGNDAHDKPIKPFMQKADSLSHGLFLLEEFLTQLK